VLRLGTLGGLHLSGPDSPVSGAPAQRKSLALLALLAAGRTSRDRLVGYLWPEASAEKARHGLAQIVYAIRKDLGADLVLGTTELWLDPDAIAVDGWEFEQALAAHDDARALELYRGPFLHGFFLTDADEFERWAESERERLRRRAHPNGGAKNLARWRG
jgi:DNA-binding SARP family transcriptional activator